MSFFQFVQVFSTQFSVTPILLLPETGEAVDPQPNWQTGPLVLLEKKTFWMMKDPSKLIVLFKLILDVLIFHFDLYEQEKSGGLWRQTIK